MNEIVNKLKRLKLSKKNIVLVAVAVICIFVLVLGELSANESKVSGEENEKLIASEYIKKTEKQLENIISGIEGVGDTEVMITLDSCYENVFAKGYSSKLQQDETELKNDSEEEYIILKKGSNNEESLIVKVYEPQVKGVAVVCEGGDDVNVKAAVTETVCSLFNISSAKVSVSKKSER